MDEDKRIPLRLWILLPLWAMGVVAGAMIWLVGIVQGVLFLFGVM
jgi:hypothetical protein